MSENQQDGQAEIRKLLDALSNFTTRAAARRGLLALGEAAVPALIESLESPIEGVAWCAAKTLGELNAEAAVHALEKALSRPGVADAAGDALKRITGEEPQGGGGPQASAYTSVRRAGMLSDEELARAFSSRTLSCRKRGGGYTVTVELAAGRKQKVEMMLSLKDTGGEPLVAFYTECGPADPARFEWVLKRNLSIPFGAFAVRESSDGDRLVMVDAYLRESVTIKQLRRAVDVLARRADKMEMDSTGRDDN